MCDVVLCVQTHADYEQRLQEEVNARLLKEQELQHLVYYPILALPFFSFVTLSSRLCQTMCTVVD